MKKYMVLCGTISIFLVTALAGEENDPPATIKEIMQEVHRSRSDITLYQRVYLGRATGKEQQRLLHLYEQMYNYPVPAGSEKNWKIRTRNLIIAVRRVIANKPGAVATLKRAVRCGVCHKEHKR